MPQFYPNYDVISKKKDFTEILTVFPVDIRWSQKKKKHTTTIRTVVSVEIRWSQKKKVFRTHFS